MRSQFRFKSLIVTGMAIAVFVAVACVPPAGTSLPVDIQNPESPVDVQSPASPENTTAPQGGAAFEPPPGLGGAAFEPPPGVGGTGNVGQPTESVVTENSCATPTPVGHLGGLSPATSPAEGSAASQGSVTAAGPVQPVITAIPEIKDGSPTIVQPVNGAPNNAPPVAGGSGTVSVGPPTGSGSGPAGTVSQTASDTQPVQPGRSVEGAESSTSTSGSQGAAAAPEPVSSVVPDISTIQDRESILDRVNKGPSVSISSGSDTVSAPPPGSASSVGQSQPGSTNGGAQGEPMPTPTPCP